MAARYVAFSFALAAALARAYPLAGALSLLQLRVGKEDASSTVAERPCDPLANIFVINLAGERGAARRDHMSKEFASAGIENYSFIAAADGATLTEWYSLADAFAAQDIRKGDGHARIHDGHIALSRSHQMAYERVLEANLPCAMVFEDDAALGLDFKGRLERVAPRLPERFHLVKLDYCDGRSPPGSVPTESTSTEELNVVWGQHGACAGSYIVSKEGAEMFIRGNTPIWMNADGALDPQHIRHSPAAYMLPLLDFHLAPKLVWQGAEGLPGGSHYKHFSYEKELRQRLTDLYSDAAPDRSL
jgi:GR25 family glycosyltransferase involved in LPS biosynthesis